MPTFSSANPICSRAMVTSPHYLATEAGLAILRKGGNALESAIAIAGVLAVVYPHMCSFGGDAFWLMYADDFVPSNALGLRGLNASGCTGSSVTLGSAGNITSLPHRGYQACLTVPGMVSALEEAFATSRELGGKLGWSELLENALFYASEGFPASSSLVAHSSRYLAQHRSDPLEAPLDTELGKALFPDGKSCALGEIIRQPDLAQSLKQLMDEGPRSFYEGSIAQKIVQDLQLHGNLLTLHDFHSYHASRVQPITVRYRDTVACNLPPNSQGMASLEILNILNNFDVRSFGHGGCDYYHLLLEATKLAFADRDRYLADPDCTHIPLQDLLSEDYGLRQAKRIDMTRAQKLPVLPGLKGDTVWFGVLDSHGNAVSWIQSLCYDFGAGIIPKDTGILLHNRATCFSLDPSHINCLAPQKRPFHTLNPALLLKHGRPLLIYGTMGGQGQPQTQTALVTRMLDFGMLPQEAIAEPRWIYGQAFGAPSAAVQVEARIPATVQKQLAERGHEIHVLGDFEALMGHAGAIWIDEGAKGRVCYGGSDPRCDGLAMGF